MKIAICINTKVNVVIQKFTENRSNPLVQTVYMYYYCSCRKETHIITVTVNKLYLHTQGGPQCQKQQMKQ
jgi:hypothetical protein